MPADEPAVDDLQDLSGFLGRSGVVVTSPSRRCLVPGAPVEPRLGPWDLGSWTGRELAELDLVGWRADPAYNAHGGESLLALVDRVGGLLASWQGDPGRIAAVTHAAVIKAAVVCALRAPVEAVWDIDVTPGSLTELHATAGGWRVVGVNRSG